MNDQTSPTIESLTAELAQANADNATYSGCIRELEKSLAASDRELEGARRGLRIMTNERDALAEKMAPVTNLVEIASRVNSALGAAFPCQPVVACRAQDAIKPFLPVMRGVTNELVTRESALNAISYVGQYNGPGREQEAIDMLAAAQSAPQAVTAPAFDQAEFDEMVRKGTAAWGDTPAPRSDVAATESVAPPLFESMALGDVAMPSVNHTKTAAALSETAASTVALGESVASQPAVPADQMDWPLPCDIKVGCGTHGKGTSLRSLVGRMQRLYDEVVAASPAPQGGLDLFVAASQQPVPALSASDHMPAYTALQTLIDFPITDPNNMDAANMKLIAIDAMTSSSHMVLSDEQILDIMSKHWEHQWGGGESRYIRFRYADMVPAVRSVLAAAEAK